MDKHFFRYLRLLAYEQGKFGQSPVFQQLEDLIFLICNCLICVQFILVYRKRQGCKFSFSQTAIWLIESFVKKLIFLLVICCFTQFCVFLQHYYLSRHQSRSEWRLRLHGGANCFIILSRGFSCCSFYFETISTIQKSYTYSCRDLFLTLRVRLIKCPVSINYSMCAISTKEFFM